MGEIPLAPRARAHVHRAPRLHRMPSLQPAALCLHSSGVLRDPQPSLIQTPSANQFLRSDDVWVVAECIINDARDYVTTSGVAPAVTGVQKIIINRCASNQCPPKNRHVTCTKQMLESLSVFCCHVTRYVDVIIHVSKEVIAQTWCGATKITDKFSLGHLVLNMGTGKVHTQ